MKRKHLKIAIFHLAFFYSGGGEKLILEEIKALKKNGHEVDCFSPVVEKKLCFPDIIGGYKIKSFFPRLPKIIEHQETLEIVLACLFFPFIALKFSKYDVVLGANQPGPWFAWLVNKIAKVPYVIYLAQPTRILYPRKIDQSEGVWLKSRARIFPILVKLTRPFIKWIDKVSIRGAEVMLVNGSFMVRILKKVYQRDAVECPAGANVIKKIVKNRWQGEEKVNGRNIKKPYILITNRHFPHKRFEYAIKAMVDISKIFKDTKLIITGNYTEYTHALIKFVKDLGLQDKIVFTGFIKEEDLPRLYANACVYVYTSPEEDFGMGVIEAMGAGVPVVAWKRGGPATTIINNKTGYLVPPYSQKEFTQRIIDLIKDKESNIIMGKNARIHVRKNYSYQRHNNLLEKTLIKVAAKDL